MKSVKNTIFIFLFAVFLLSLNSCSQNTGRNVGGCENGTYSKSKTVDSIEVKDGI